MIGFFIRPGGKAVTCSVLNLTLRPYFKSLGLNGNSHLLRHTLATHLIQSGMPLRHVQELLGHTSMQATLVYVHLVIDDLKKEYKKCFPQKQKLSQS